MCTVMTISREYFDVFPNEVINRISEDAIINSDGFSLLLMGEAIEDQSLVRTNNINTVIALLENETWTRAWIHCRMATTASVGLTHTHGFTQGDWVTFHNGCIRNKQSDSYHVDSELLSVLVGTMGVESAMTELYDETYINAFFINTNTGEWSMVRREVNTLYTDNEGNYSTKPCALIDTPVPFNTINHHIHDMEATYERFESYTSYGSEEWEKYEVKNALNEYDFRDLVLDMGWEYQPVPESVWQLMNKQQRTWLAQIQDSFAMNNGYRKVY